MIIQLIDAAETAKVEAIAIDGRERELARRCARGRLAVAVPGVESCDRDHTSAAAG